MEGWSQQPHHVWMPRYRQQITNNSTITPNGRCAFQRKMSCSQLYLYPVKCYDQKKIKMEGFFKMHVGLWKSAQTRAINRRGWVELPGNSQKIQAHFWCVIRLSQDILHTHSSFLPELCLHIHLSLGRFLSKFFSLPHSPEEIFTSALFLSIFMFCTSQQQHCQDSAKFFLFLFLWFR